MAKNQKKISEFKGGGAWPNWPNGKYAYAVSAVK